MPDSTPPPDAATRRDGGAAICGFCRKSCGSCWVANVVPIETSTYAGTLVAESLGMLRFLTIASIASFASACVVSESSMRVENRSDFEIHEMYVTEIDSPTWGANLLRGDILMPDETMYIGLENGTYDALLIDETGAACEVFNIDLRFEDADWVIRNTSCAVFEQRAALAAQGSAK